MFFRSFIYRDKNAAVVTAVEGVEDQTMEVRAIDLSTGEVVWNSTEEEFE